MSGGIPAGTERARLRAAKAARSRWRPSEDHSQLDNGLLEEKVRAIARRLPPITPDVADRLAAIFRSATRIEGP